MPTALEEETSAGRSAAIRRRGLTPPMAATKWCYRRDALRWRLLTSRGRPRRSVALHSPAPTAATTERGPPYHLKTCAQNARMFRH